MHFISYVWIRKSGAALFACSNTFTYKSSSITTTNNNNTWFISNSPVECIICIRCTNVDRHDLESHQAMRFFLFVFDLILSVCRVYSFIVVGISCCRARYVFRESNYCFDEGKGRESKMFKIYPALALLLSHSCPLVLPFIQLLSWDPYLLEP